MEPFEQAFRLKAKIQRERLHFVKSELALGFTFLDFAKVTQQPDTRERNIENASKAYDQVAHVLAGEFDCSDEERADLERALARLKARLNEQTYA